MIGQIIPKQGFELIGERIVSILCEEFAYQVSKFGNLACKDVRFFKDRITIIGEQEGDVINVALWKGDYNNKSVNYADGHYQYVIDVVTSSKSKSDHPADRLANEKLQRLMGIIRYVLEHPDYRLLSFDAPFIRHTEIMKFQVLRPDDLKSIDSTIMAQGQIIFLASCREVTVPGDGVSVTGVLSSVKVDEKEFGYEFQFVAE